mgnify:CR=1 FL=1
MNNPCVTSAITRLAPALRERYFSSQGKQGWTISQALRSQVDFYHLNLLADNQPAQFGYFDIIFFRNVSIYFDEPTRRVALQRLAALLAPDGMLIMGSAETLSNDFGVIPLVLEDGVFTQLAVEPKGGVDVSACSAILERLS